jgi:hypothetical protein
LRKSVDFAFDDHPAGDDERPRAYWAVAIIDDCDACEDLRVELTVEEEGGSATGVTSHLSAATARRLRASLAAALREIGEDPGA